ncbi:cupin domain-containing protein [Desulfobacterales bacterium HSG16]|nr:cupin domain-containing protein [Desulfobacterales bacterium HSG16]
MAAKDKIDPIGKKIKKARLDSKKSLEEIANNTGHSIDYLKAVEAGKEMPPVGALLQISRALEVDSGFFLREQEDTLQKRVDQYTKRTDNYAYATLTPGAENKHLKAFRIIIDPHQDHEGVGYEHKGEEFVYVLNGTIEVMVGDHVNALEKDDSLHFNSGIKHQLKNTGDEKAELLVVIYGP